MATQLRKREEDDREGLLLLLLLGGAWLASRIRSQKPPREPGGISPEPAPPGIVAPPVGIVPPVVVYPPQPPPPGNGGINPNPGDVPWIARGDGNRVYVYVADGDTSAPHFLWTEEIYAASPRWYENSSGLSGEVLGWYETMALDPFAPQARVYMIVGGSGAASGVLYRNDSVRGTGTWKAILNTTIYESVTGDTGRSRVTFRGICCTIAQDGFVACLADPRGGAAGTRSPWILHSHDYGEHWTAVQLLGDAGSLITISDSFRPIAIGQHDGSIVYVVANKAYDLAENVCWASADGAHSFAPTGIVVSDLAALVKLNILLPYDNNPSDLIFYIYDRDVAIPIRSNDGGTTVITPSVVLVGDMEAVNGSGSVETLIARTSAYDAAISSSGASSWSTAPATIERISPLKLGRYYALASSSPFVMTSPDWVNFADRSGDLVAVMGSGGVGSVWGVVPDWMS